MNTAWLSPASRPVGRHLRGCTLVAAWLLAPLIVLGGVDIPYYGHKVVHLVYSHSNPLALSVELRVKRLDADWAVLSSGSRSITGKLRDDGLAAGDHAYEVRQKVVVPDPQDPDAYIQIWQTVSLQTATLNGRTVNGTLQYDETFASTTVVARAVSVPDGITLTLDQGTVDRGDPSAYIEVYGSLSIDSATVAAPYIFLHAHPYHFSAPGQVNLFFAPTTAGSSITGGTNLYAEFYHDQFTLTDCTPGARIAVALTAVSLSRLENITLIPKCDSLTLAGMSNVWLELADVRGAIAITGGNILFSGTSQPQYIGNRFDFDNMTWQGARPIFRHAVTMARCDFQSGLEVANTTLKANDSSIGHLVLEKAEYGTQINRCLLRGGATITSGEQEFQDCEFGGRVGLHNRSATRIEGCILLDRIYIANDVYNHFPQWHESLTPMPIILNNSFLGMEALDVQDGLPTLPEPITIGANYYGDPSGLRTGYPESEFLGWGRTHEGAWLVGNNSGRFKIAAPLASGPMDRKDKRVFPKFWVNGWIAGQNTIPHHGGGAPLMRGRDTLLSVELLTSDRQVRGVRVYARYNGQDVNARFSGPLARDITTVRPSNVFLGARTFDIVLPAHAEASMPVTVFADYSGVTGFDADVVPADPVELLSTTLAFTLEPPTRNMVVSVVPIRLEGLLWSQGPPGPGDVVRVLKTQLPAMFPIPANRVEVRVDPPVTVASSADWVSTLPLMYKVAAVLTGRNTVCNAFLGNPGYRAPDFTIAVMPSGSLHMLFGWGKADGANPKIFRDIVLVDETRTSAVIHELGHAMGLYLAKEQYDATPPSGRRISAVTAFWTEPGAPASKFNALNRALHFPGEWYNWYQDFDWFDIMSNVDETIWPMASTLNAFNDWFQANLYSAPAPGRASAALDEDRMPLAEPAAGLRRVLVMGQTTKVSTTAQHDFMPGSVTLFDLTGQNMAPIPPPASGIWQSLCLFRAYNAARDVLHETPFYVPASSDKVQNWVGTFDIPQAARMCTIEQENWPFPNKTSVVWRAQGTLSNHILSPAPGATVGTELALTWQAACTGANGTSNLAHLVLFSTTGGASWLNPTMPQTATQLVTSTEFLPPCNNLAIRVVTSDGFTNVQSMVSGLSIPNRAPRVTILEPPDGEVSVTGVLWRLQAQIEDFDGNVSSAGVWTSSRQGVLASNALAQCVLTQGVHTLRYTVADDAGAESAATVQVTVSPVVTTIDLGLAPNALQVTSRREDPVSPVPVLLTVGETNRISVRFRTPAVPGSARLSIFGQAPGRGPELLNRQTMAFNAVGWATLAAGYVPAAFGNYDIQAVLDAITPADPNSANNARAWTLGTRNPELTPSRRFAQLEYVLGPMENPSPGFVYKNNVRIDVYNTGLDNLVVGPPVLQGPNAPHCRVFNNQTINTPIAPTEFKSLTVETGMTNRGMYRATLQLTSNDPEHPVVTVDFLSLLYNAGQNVDTDGDGVYDFIETVMGTSTNLADTDGDGLSDGAEDVNRNGIVDDGETAARVADTDGDGLADGVEDANHNGVWDYGESATRVGDTDGDGMLDGHEGLAGTHPFDPASVFAVDGVSRAAGGSGRVVRWHSVAGRHYRVTRSTNLLTDAFSVAIATNIPAMPPLNTVTDTTAIGVSPHYYRIELESGVGPALP